MTVCTDFDENSYPPTGDTKIGNGQWTIDNFFFRK